jgi:hypothetical protein
MVRICGISYCSQGEGGHAEYGIACVVIVILFYDWGREFFGTRYLRIPSKNAKNIGGIDK